MGGQGAVRLAPGLPQQPPQTHQGGVGAFQGLPGKGEVAAVVSAQHQVTVCQWLVARIAQLLQGDDIALRLAHALLFSQHQVLPVQPVAHERVAGGRFGLRNLVGVVYGDVIGAPGVNVEAVAQVLHGHGRALDVPAGEALAPRAVPLHLPFHLRRAELPEGKVRLVALAAHFHPRALLQALHLETRQPAVALEARRIEVDAVVGAVGEALGLEVADQGDLLGDVAGGPRKLIRALDVQPVQIVQVALRILLGDLPGRALRLARRLLHLVLARVRVRGEVAHVGHVDHVAHLVAQAAQGFLQNVREDVAAQVADVRLGVDGGAAGVNARLTDPQRDERLLAAGQRVVQPQIHTGSIGPRRSR